MTRKYFVFSAIVLLHAVSTVSEPRAESSDYSQPSAQHPPGQPGSFSDFLEGIEGDAVAAGVSPQTAHSALAAVSLDETVLTLDEKQPEKTIAFEDYARRIVSADRVATGQRMLRENEEILSVVSQRFGIPPELILALWGVESSYGKNSGDFSVVNSLATLAYGGRRAGFFRQELVTALKIVERNHIPAFSLRGSWAGAMGQCQFMPSTYVNYAVGFTGSVPDIWSNPADVFSSIANYMLANGWRRDAPWGMEVRMRSAVPDELVGLGVTRSVGDWMRLGVDGDVRSVDVSTPASLIAPDGEGGRHFLVYDNFRAIMRWNHSTFFATSVGLLADRIRS